MAARATLLLILSLLFLPGVAQAQGKRLETFRNISGQFYHRSSDDGGSNWSDWTAVPGDYPGGFVGGASVVSDQAGRLWLAAKAGDGNIVFNVYTSSNDTWRGWAVVAGSKSGDPGGAFIETGWYSFQGYRFNWDSYPAMSSWGPGRVELFMNTTRDSDGAIALLHTWADNGVWSGTWENLGTGLMHGSPAAVSWGGGRTDVFVRGGGNELAHKSFANGAWSRGWEDLGGNMTSDPAVTSSGPDRLLVFARGPDGHMWNTWYNHGWGGWGDLGGWLGASNTLSATSRAIDAVDVFVFGSDQTTLFQRSYDYWNGGWKDFQNIGLVNDLYISAAAWVPTRRLELFENLGGLIYHKWSGDAGHTWSADTLVQPAGGYYNGNVLFTGTPAVVSDRPGRLWVTAKTTSGRPAYNVYTANTDTWSGWFPIPGDPGIYDGGVWIRQGSCCTVINYVFTQESDTALASWGPGRIELFINAVRLTDNATVLLHTWADNGEWSSKWEVLQSGLLQGSPTAISWGPGRTDVFVRANNELNHKWFANGTWSVGWENLGPYITSSPSVASAGPGHLDVYARGGDGALWHRWFSSYWSAWESQGGFIADATGPTAASSGPGNLDVFVTGGDQYLWQKSYNYTWGPFINRRFFSEHTAVVYWTR